MIQKIKKLWQRLVCEYEVRRSIYPPTYPEAMQELLLAELGASSAYKHINAVQALSKGDQPLWFVAHDVHNNEPTDEKDES